jgi:hypothetical protein
MNVAGHGSEAFIVTFTALVISAIHETREGRESRKYAKHDDAGAARGQPRSRYEPPQNQ